MKEYETDEWIKRVDVTPKLEIYSFYKRHYEKDSYCEVMLKRWQRSLLAELRLGVFP